MRLEKNYENKTNHALMFTSQQWLKVHSIVPIFLYIFLYSILFVNYGCTNFATPSADDENNVEFVTEVFKNQYELNVNVLQGHNYYRLKFNMPILKVDVQLMKSSKERSIALLQEKYSSENIRQPESPNGENTFSNRTNWYEPPANYIVHQWFKEIDYFYLRSDEKFRKMRNVTQILWKSTKRVGCNYHSRKAYFEDTSFENDYFFVCHYYPPISNSGMDENFFEPMMMLSRIQWNNGTLPLKPIFFLLLLSFMNFLYHTIY